MQKHIIKCTLIMSAIWLFAHNGHAQSSQICNLFGAVYIENNPNKAHYLVYEAESESSADMLVFQEENRLFADRKGAWFFTTNRGLADFVISIVSNRDRADFSIYYTEVPSFAGCQ